MHSPAIRCITTELVSFNRILCPGNSASISANAVQLYDSTISRSGSWLGLGLARRSARERERRNVNGVLPWRFGYHTSSNVLLYSSSRYNAITILGLRWNITLETRSKGQRMSFFSVRGIIHPRISQRKNIKDLTSPSNNCAASSFVLNFVLRKDQVV